MANNDFQNGFALGVAAKGKVLQNTYPINVTFQVPNGTSPETYTEHTKVGIKANGKIAEPTTPSVPQGKFFQGWKDGNTTVTFPYAPSENKTLSADIKDIDLVDYIQSSGSQYIDTLVSSCDGIEIKFAYTAIQNGKYIYGAGDNYTDYRFFTNLYNGNFQIAMGDDSHTFQGISADTNFHTIKSGTNVVGNGAYFDTNNLNIVKGSISSRSLFLFGYNTFEGSSYYNLGSCKIYYAKLYKQGVLVADFVPCRSHESGHDNELCLFDYVSETYFYNQGTGSFTTAE